MKSVHTRALKRSIEDLLDTVKEAQGHLDDLSTHGNDLSYLNASNSIGSIFTKIRCFEKDISQKQPTFLKVEYCLQRPACLSFTGADGKVYTKGKVNPIFFRSFCRVCGPRSSSVYDTITSGLICKDWLVEDQLPYQTEDKRTGTLMTILSVNVR
jgi:hypothetical protein